MTTKSKQKLFAKKMPDNFGSKESSAIQTDKSESAIWRYALFLGILAFCIYANTLQNGFALDDTLAIKTNSLVKSGITAIPDILSTPYHKGNLGVTDNLYRPLSLVMFAIEYNIFPGNPMPGHLVNILLFAGCVMLFFFFLHHLFKKKKQLIAFVAALLFAMHPLHTEVVANIKSRDELLCFFFSFLALNSFIKYTETGTKWALVGGSFFYFLSLLSKETSITMLAIIPIIFFFYRNENKKKSITILLFSVTAAAFYLTIRFSVLISDRVYDRFKLTIYENALVIAPSFASRLATEILILGQYLRLLIIPYPLISNYSYNAIPFVDFSSAWVWLSLLLYISLTFFGVYRLIRKRNDPTSFGILFFLITITLFSNILFLTGSEMSERFTFFPSAGFCLLAACAIECLVNKKEITGIESLKNKWILMTIIPIATIFIFITINRNIEWQNDFSLYDADTKKSPDNFLLFYLAGNEQMLLLNASKDDVNIKRQMLRNAITDFEKSITIYPNLAQTHLNLALAFMAARQLDSAKVHCEKTLILNPYNDNAKMTLVNIYTEEKKYSEALTLLKKMCVEKPANSTYFFDAGICFVFEKEYDSAINYFRKSLSFNPANRKALEFTAVAYHAMGKMDSATHYEILAKQYDSHFSIDKINLPK